jgi:hypothetical protein
MNGDRYEQLLGRLLDDELGTEEAEELATWLRKESAALVDVRRHLFLWESYAQHHREERSAGAFVKAWETRLLAEADGQSFVERVETRLRESAAVASAVPARTFLSVVKRLRRVLFSLRWIMTGAVAVAVVGLFLWLFPKVNNEPTLSVAGSARVTLERDGRVYEAQDGTRVVAGDLLNVSGTNSVTIKYGKEPTSVAINAGTQLKILPRGKGKRFELTQGKVEGIVTRQRPWQPMTLITAQAEARVLGTRFTLTTTPNATRLEVTEGKVKLTRKSDASSATVGAGYYAVAASNYDLAALPLTGSIFREYWTNIPGDTWTDLITHTNYPSRPDGFGILTNLSSFEMPANWADNYGERLRGYLQPPKTGEYTFWIAARDDASLWLTPDENPENKLQMAYSQGAAPRDWQSRAAQQSASVQLIAGKQYYFEVLHKAGVGDDSLAVAWQGPGWEREVIPISFLSPFKTQGKEKKQ